VSEIQGIGRLKFHDGELEEFRRLSMQAMEIVRAKDTAGPGASRTTARIVVVAIRLPRGFVHDGGMERQRWTNRPHWAVRAGG
jgi:hypothetical protein